MDKWHTKHCAICNKDFSGQDFMTRCRECYWNLIGFSWQCPKRKMFHTPEELRQLTYGWPFGSGMWGNKQVLLTIKAIGGFEQYSYENWDELWEAEVYVDPPVKASGPCLLCVIKELRAKRKEINEQNSQNPSGQGSQQS